MMTANDWMQDATTRAKAASAALATAPAEARNAALLAAAAAIRARAGAIGAANARDLAAFDAGGGTVAFRDRLALTPARIEAMARGLEEIAALPDPLARVLADWT
ncbi:MAG: gamma-glutamyl-phosphate reductase, partial [Alphaproteobacteria bacterium]|nr:gamma-glutamyl-phosphate reductase [Alphaproteobacteria bacterium]